MKQRIVLLGPPASGKGTQAELLVSSFGIPHVSTGALLRVECANGTSVGKEADRWTSQGLLVPDELAIRLITIWIAEHGTKFLFDGFPRTVAQAESLDTALAALRAPLDLVIVLELGEEEICRRIASRLSCLHCGATFSCMLNSLKVGDMCLRCGEKLLRRTDDQPAAVEKRLESYRELTFPVIGYYERTAPELIHRVDASMESDAVFSEICELIRS